uniref:Secreted protein n=1 Tax=Globodera pallida TaxID=36090 RepID=A0A183BKK0_GLOPA
MLSSSSILLALCRMCSKVGQIVVVLLVMLEGICRMQKLALEGVKGVKRRGCAVLLLVSGGEEGKRQRGGGMELTMLGGGV